MADFYNTSLSEPPETRGGGPGEDQPSLASLLDTKSEQTPEVIAVSGIGQSLTYRHLAAQSNRLARRLIQRGAKPNCLVGVMLDRTSQIVVALCAVVKAGAAFIWLDPAYPRQRLALMLEDASPILLLTNGKFLGSLPDIDPSRRILLDEEIDSLTTGTDGPLDLASHAEDLTYAIYTSGSTGRPKGVAMSWGVLSNLLTWQMDTWTRPTAARTLQFAALSFDVSFQEIFSTLCSGGTLILPPDEIRRDPPALLRLLQEEAVERIFLPFVALQQIAEAYQTRRTDLPRLREVITAGEQLQITPQIRNLFECLTHCRLQNQYGPAETHVVTAYTLTGEPGSWPLLPPIGTPISNARVLILGDDRAPVPDGNAGEIYIGGPVLARGYINQPLLTAERFIFERIANEGRVRLYRTGDMGRISASGEIEFLGRKDHQVKVRGVRAEPGEIEILLAQYPGVAQTAVCADEVSPGDTRLYAYIVSKETSPPTQQALRDYLEAHLPSQLIPSAFIFLNEMPVTPNGKIDRLALKSAASKSSDRHHEPSVDGGSATYQNETQTLLAAIWTRLLGNRPDSIHASFFQAGGDSLLAVQLCTEIERVFARQLSTAAVFESPSIEKLSLLVTSNATNASAPSLEAIHTDGSKPPLFCIPTLLDLGRELGADQPVYGFPLSAILTQVDQVDQPSAVVPAVASRWLEEIRQAQPRGPYYLAGHSFGGVVAFEAALRLSEQGEDVALLALLEPDPPKPARHASLKWISTLPFRIFRRLLEVNSSSRVSYLVRRAKLGKDQIASKLHAVTNFAEMKPLKKLDALVGTYHARKFPGRITLCCAQDNERGFGSAPALQWKAASGGGIDVHQVPGDHLTIIRRPNVASLAKIFRSVMAKTSVICCVFSAALPSIRV